MQPRNKNKFFTLIGCLAAAGAVVFYYSGGHNEPKHKGKPLTHWVDHLGSIHEPLDPNAETTHAIRAIGAKALPQLEAMLTAPDEFSIAEKLRFRLSNDPSFILTKHDRAWKAARAIEILGTEATPSIPRLSRSLQSGSSRTHTAAALIFIGPEGIAAVTNAFNHPNATTRNAAIQAFAFTKPTDQSITQAIIAAANDTDPSVRFAVAGALARSTNFPSVAIPALIRLVEDQDRMVKIAALVSLPAFARGNPPPEIIRAFEQAKTDPDGSISSMATTQLQLIYENTPNEKPTASDPE